MGQFGLGTGVTESAASGSEPWSPFQTILGEIGMVLNSITYICTFMYILLHELSCAVPKKMACALTLMARARISSSNSHCGTIVYM